MAVAQLYTKLATDVRTGEVEVQQAKHDLEFAAAAERSVGGMWATKKVAAAVQSARLAVAGRQLQMQRQRA